jgi:hypothetical protein
MIKPDKPVSPHFPSDSCPGCPWVIVSDLSATELPCPDGRFVRLRIDKADVILTRQEFFVGLKRAKAVKRVESFQRKSPK